MTFFGDNDEDNLRSAKRERTIFSTMAIGHILAVLIPFALISWGFWEQEQPEELSINIVDEASVGPVVAMETTRLPFSETPTPDVIPEPTPEPPTPEPPAPEPIPTPPPAPSEPSFELPKMPTVVEEAPAPKPSNSPKPIPQKIVAQPKFDMPKLPTPKAKPKPTPKDERVFTPIKDNSMTTTKTGVKSSNNANELVPIGNKDAAQRYGETFSNTAQGGKNKSEEYTAKLGGFLKMHWRNYAPSRAELGGIDFESKIALHIDGSGNLISGTITKSSGNPTMDAAVRRMLNNLNKFPMPDDRQPVKISSITITLE